MTQLRTINSSASFALCRERQKEKLQVSEERVAQLTEELQKMRVEQVRGTHSSPRPPAPRPPAHPQRAGCERASQASLAALVSTASALHAGRRVFGKGSPFLKAWYIWQVMECNGSNALQASH